MRMYCLEDGKRFDKNHPKWPNKKDGTPYKVLTNSAIESTGLTLVPSVTSILDPAKGHKLVNWAFWKAGKIAVEFLKTGPCYNDEQELEELAESFINEKRNEPADAGSDVHDLLDRYVKSCANDSSEVAEATRAFIIENSGPDILRCRPEEQFACTVEGMSFGGTVDVQDQQFVLDYKTTDGKREPYITECAQLWAYDMFAKNGRRLVNVYIDRNTMRPYLYKEWNNIERERAFDVFNACYNLLMALEEI